MAQLTAAPGALQTKREQIEQAAQYLGRLALDLETGQKSLRQMVTAYDDERTELFKQELLEHEITWCTRCSESVPEAETKLLLIEGKKNYSHGYGDAYYGIQSFSQLHRVCPACHKRDTDRHGEKGKYDSQLKDQTCFYAFPVEKRDDGLYVCKFGHWSALNATATTPEAFSSCTLDNPPKELIEKFANEWGLPPKIELRRDYPLGPEKLFIRE